MSGSSLIVCFWAEVSKHIETHQNHNQFIMAQLKLTAHCRTIFNCTEPIVFLLFTWKCFPATWTPFKNQVHDFVIVVVCCCPTFRTRARSPRVFLAILVDSATREGPVGLRLPASWGFATRSLSVGFRMVWSSSDRPSASRSCPKWLGTFSIFLVSPWNFRE